MAEAATASQKKGHSRKVPQRPYGSVYQNEKLPSTVPAIALGCSSFSHFFMSDENPHKKAVQNVEELKPDSPPIIREWISTIHHAILERGINLLDTAPWYGHGSSEVVVGFALRELLQGHKLQRSDVIVNTKVGRYEEEPSQQFDFSHAMTMHSVKRSLQRLCVDYIDVMQIHDVEFAPSMQQLLEETIPALLQCRDQHKWIRAIGITGYPLEVQHEILKKSSSVSPFVFDQSLTYCHCNLHDSTLFQSAVLAADGDATQASGKNGNEIEQKSFADYCHDQGIAMMAAAPLSMGLLTHSSPPIWHPASQALKDACRQAAAICEQEGVNLAALATFYALGVLVGDKAAPVPSTIIGCRNVDEVDRAADAALRFRDCPSLEGTGDHWRLLRRVLSEHEWRVIHRLLDKQGPFVSVWKSGDYQWDGKQQAREFWSQLERKP